MAANPLNVTVREMSLATVPQKSLAKAWALSDDLRRLAYARHRDGQWQIVLDNRVQATFRDVHWLMFSPDGRRLAAEVTAGQYRMVWLSGADDAVPCESILRGSACFSPDSRQLAYLARKGGAWVVVHGQTQTDLPRGATPHRLLFSPDGKRLGVVLSRSGNWSIQFGDTPGKEYERLAPESVTFAPDGRLAFAVTRSSAQVGLEQVLVIDDKVQQGHGALHISQLTFSPDGKRVAYVVKRRGSGGIEHAVVVDDAPGKGFESEGIERLTFSPDGSRLAAVVVRYGAGGPEQFVLDGSTEHKPTERIVGRPLFSPDSKRLLFVAGSRARGAFHSEAALIENGAEKHRYRDIHGMAFSLEGGYWCATATSLDGRSVLVVNDIETRARIPSGERFLATGPASFRYISRAVSPAGAEPADEIIRVDALIEP